MLSLRLHNGLWTLYSGSQAVISYVSHQRALEAMLEASDEEIAEPEPEPDPTPQRRATDQPDADDAPDCDHTWELVSDEQGDPREAHLYESYAYFECTDCGETRDVDDRDRAKWKDEADYDRWEARRGR